MVRQWEFRPLSSAFFGRLPRRYSGTAQFCSWNAVLEGCGLLTLEWELCTVFLLVCSPSLLRVLLFLHFCSSLAGPRGGARAGSRIVLYLPFSPLFSLPPFSSLPVLRWPILRLQQCPLSPVSSHLFMYIPSPFSVLIFPRPVAQMPIASALPFPLFRIFVHHHSYSLPCFPSLSFLSLVLRRLIQAPAPFLPVPFAILCLAGSYRPRPSPPLRPSSLPSPM